MRCPYCQHLEDRVIDSRASREGRAVRRRRECIQCARRFTTYEYIEERPLQVIKRTGEIEPYDRRKILRSIEVAAAKRPIPPGTIDAIVEDLEHKDLDERAVQSELQRYQRELPLGREAAEEEN